MQFPCLSQAFLQPLPPSVFRWRSVRVFISSTFRDMHAERDTLVQTVFPELRRRAAAHCLYMQEVELRWGVTEEESVRATELCLSEVSRSQMMVGILGERYGLIPPKPVLSDLSQYNWVRYHCFIHFLSEYFTTIRFTSAVMNAPYMHNSKNRVLKRPLYA